MPPLAIAAGVAAVGTIGGALISSSATSKAASQANASQQAATQAQLQLGRETLGLNTQIYNSNYGTLSPFVQRGNVAGDSINALLGLPASAPTQSPMATTASAQPGTNSLYSGPSLAQIQAMQHDGVPGNYRAALNAYNAADHSAPAPAPVAAAPAQTTPPVTPINAMDAYNNFANSAGIKAQMQGLNQNYAAKGLLQSGAAMKGLQQNALTNYFLPYAGLLGGQQAVGAGAASAIAGVGQNFGNTAANIAGQMGNSLQNGADGASNAAIMRGYAGAQLGAGIASGIGSIASSFMPSGGFGGGSSWGGYSGGPSISDRRLKTNIEKVGEATDGLGIYEWEYKFDPSNTRCRGVMADEVEKLRPWAFVPNFRGEYAGVDYAKLGAL
jgi:hypothetical protein